MKKADLAKEIFSACYLEGNFTLRSGLRSKEYFDKYRMEALPRLLSPVTELMLALIPQETEILAGLETGGIPLATALSLKTGLPARFVRKKPKTYGTMQFCEGGPVKGKALCLIEDVVTTGGQVMESARALKEEGADVRSALCVIFRGQASGLQALQKAGLQLSWLFRREDLTRFKKI